MSSRSSNVNLEKLLSRLSHVQARADGRGWYAKCPAHESRYNKANLGVWIDDRDGREIIRVYCFAGCHKEEVLARVGMHFRELYPAAGTTPPRSQLSGCAHSRVGSATPGEAASADAHAPPSRATSAAARDLKRPPQDWSKWLNHCRSNSSHERWLTAFAQRMGKAVPFAALDRLGCGVEFDGNEWRMLTPERDQLGREIGLAVRWLGGEKRQKPGSRRGLVYEPFFLARLSGPILMPEGGSDTAAALAAGLSAVGRPSNTGGLELSVALLSDKAVYAHDIIVLGENDKKADGSHPGSAGREFAQKLADRLNRPVQFAYPPDGEKDLRAWMNRHGSDGGEFLRRLRPEELMPRPKPEPKGRFFREEEVCYFVTSDLFERHEDLARVVMHLRCGRNAGCDGCLRRKRRLWREHLEALFNKTTDQGRFHVACVRLHHRGAVTKAIRDYCKKRGLKPTAVFVSVVGGWLQVISAHPFAGSHAIALPAALALLGDCLCNEQGREIAVPVGRKRTRFIWARGAWVLKREKKEAKHTKLGRLRDGASLRLAAEVRDWKYQDERPDDMEVIRKETALPPQGVSRKELEAFDAELLVPDSHGGSNGSPRVVDTTIEDEPGSYAEAKRRVWDKIDQWWEWAVEKIGWQKG